MQNSEERRSKQHPNENFRGGEDSSKGFGILNEYREVRENYDFQWGQPWGDLALALDIMGDLTAQLGQHGMYCRGAKDGATRKIPSDLARMLEGMDGVRALIRQILVKKKESLGDPPLLPQG